MAICWGNVLSRGEKILLVVCVLLPVLVAIGYPADLMVVRIARQDFVGGKLSAWRSVIDVPAGSGTTWAVIRTEPGEAEFVLNCVDGRRTRGGYLEGRYGPLSYVGAAVSDCRIENSGYPRVFILAEVGFLFLIAGHFTPHR